MGLAYVHQEGRVHRYLVTVLPTQLCCVMIPFCRNFKASHILVGVDGTVKLADFSVSASLIDKGHATKATTVVGSLAWMAPEVMELSEVR